MNDSFLAAIRATPHDDLPRLIYADYLDERGDPRGEFIRLQIDLMHASPTDRMRDELLAREAELLAAHEDEWIGSLGDQLYRWWFHRGFLEVSLSIDRFLGDDELWNHVHVAGIHLHPPSYMDASLVLKLAGSPRAMRVRSLYLGFEWVQDEMAIALALSEHLPHLAALDLGNNGLTDSGVSAIARSKKLPALQALALANNLITDRGAKALARSTARTGLRQLDLSNNEITDVGFNALKKSRNLRHLTELSLDGNRVATRRRPAQFKKSKKS